MPIMTRGWSDEGMTRCLQGGVFAENAARGAQGNPCGGRQAAIDQYRMRGAKEDRSDQAGASVAHSTAGFGIAPRRSTWPKVASPKLPPCVLAERPRRTGRIP